MDNVHNCDSYINIPSSQTYRSYVNLNYKIYHHIQPLVQHSRGVCSDGKSSRRVKLTFHLRPESS
jgi:hypothetical protein